jgi:hypothetical protein
MCEACSRYDLKIWIVIQTAVLQFSCVPFRQIVLECFQPDGDWNFMMGLKISLSLQQSLSYAREDIYTNITRSSLFCWHSPYLVFAIKDHYHLKNIKVVVLLVKITIQLTYGIHGFKKKEVM